MDELNQILTASNGGIMLRSGSSWGDEEEPERHYHYYYYVNNLTYVGLYDYEINYLSSYASSRTFVDSKLLVGSDDPGHDEYECIGSRYNSAAGATITTAWLIVGTGCKATNTTVYSSGVFKVYGVAHDTTVYGGSMSISSGVASNTLLNSGALSVADGGTAKNITVNSWGLLGVIGGFASDITITSGIVYVEGNGTINTVTINSGEVNVRNKGRLYNATLNGSVYMTHGGSGITSNIILNSGAQNNISSTGTAYNTTINSLCSMTITESGTASSTTVNFGGLLRVWSSGRYGTPNAIDTVENGGYVSICYGAKVTFVSNTLTGLVLSNTSASVHSNTVANGFTVISSGLLDIFSGGVANDATVGSGGHLTVFSGGTGNNTIVDSAGQFLITTGGTANSAIVNSGGQLVLSYGSANSAAVNAGGKLQLLSGATATEIIENGGYVSVDIYYQGEEGYVSNAFTGVVLSGDSATVHSGTTACATEIGPNGRLEIYSGGTADGTEVNAGGNLVVFSSGSVVDTTVISGGSVLLLAARAENTTVNAGGNLVVSSSGSATGTTVNSGGKVSLGNGCLAENNTVNSGGSFLINSGVATNNTVNSGGLLSAVSGLTTSTTVNLGGSARFTYSGIATEIVENGGFVYCEASAAFASHTFTGAVLSGDSATAHSGTTACDTVIDSQGLLIVYSGGSASNAVINSGGSLQVYIGGITDSATINSGGSAQVNARAIVTNTKVNVGGSITIFANGAAFGFIENGGFVYLDAYTSATFSSNSISGLLLSGDSATVHSGTTAIDTTIAEGGLLSAFSCGKVTGQTTIVSGGSLWAAFGAVLDFDISELTPLAPARINDLSRVQGWPSFTLTVSERKDGRNTQKHGTYTLAEGAASYRETITVVDTVGRNLGKLEIGTPVLINDTYYTLKLTDDVLTVKVGMEPVEVDFEFTEIEQTVYYSGGKPAGSELDGTLMMIPYTADITVTLDKDFEEGEYEFATLIDEIPEAITRFKIGIADAEGVPGLNGEEDKWSVSYISDNACYYGTKIQETDSTVTYKFTDVNDFILIDAIPDDTLNIKNEYDSSSGATDSYTVTFETETENVMYFCFSFVAVAERPEKAYPDVNKNYKPTRIEIGNGESFSFLIEVSSSDIENNKYNYSLNYTIGNKTFDSDYLTVTERGEWTTFTVKVDSDLNADITLVINNTTGQTDLAQSYMGGGLKDRNVIVTPDGAPWDDLHCWVAIASNMLSAAGYLSISANECYETLNKYYFFENDKNISEMKPVSYVFKDLIRRYDIQLPYHLFTINEIEDGLKHLEKGPDEIIGSISLDVIDEKETISSHGITCYEVKLNNDQNSGTFLYADSDDKKDGPIRTTIEKRDDGKWHIVPLDKDKFKDLIVTEIYTLIPNKKDGKTISLETDAVTTTTSTTSKYHVYSMESHDISLSEDGNVTVNGDISGSVVLDGGDVTIASGAEAKEMVVHEGGTVKFNSGSTAKGTIRTAGGTLTVESGVNVSEAKFDFDVSYMSDGHSKRILNDLHNVSGAELTITIVDRQSAGQYVLAGGASDFAGAFSVIKECNLMYDAGEDVEYGLIGELGLDNTLDIEDKTYSLTLVDDNLVLTIAANETSVEPPEDPVGTPDKVSWKASGADGYVVEYSTDNFEHVISVVTTGNAVDTPDLPAGTYQWRVRADADNSEWAVGEAIKSELEPGTPEVVRSNEDGNDDLFFATPSGMWGSIFSAQHVGSVNDGWGGTNEIVSAKSKGKIQNLFFGSADPNVLCLSDDANGDALFVDDVFTDLPEEIAENTARLFKIHEIRAGAGSDIVDMTSQRFEYTGDGLIIRGGDGNDTIWANRGDNRLFGDAGNDRIVGASGNDVIVGGYGSDSMHGGGGNDVFAFCNDWGEDTVEQLATGTVTLWFASGSETNWNAETLTYTDGGNSVTVSGVSAGRITLKFGDDGSEQFAALSDMGAFDGLTSQKVFEDSDNGLLA